MTLSRLQRVALKRIFDRQPMVLTYRQFRRTVQAGYDRLIMVPWSGMVLGIEADGYTHS